MHRLALLVAASAVAVFAAACTDDGIIYDDWGPPAGYATLIGTVQRPDGTPAGDVEVVFSRCGEPVGGFLAGAKSSASGTFEVQATLPPVGVLPNLAVDSLQLRCSVFLDRTGIARDSVSVRFATTAASAPVTRLILQLP